MTNYFVTKSFTPSSIIFGPANVFIDVAAPPSAIPPTYGTNTWGLGSSAGSYYIDANGQPFDNSTKGGLLTITTPASGTGYAAGDVFGITQAGATNGTGVVLTVSGGVPATIAVLSPGQNYSTASGLATTVITGSGDATLTVTISTISAGIHIGLSDGPVTVGPNPKFHEIRADQHAGPVDAAFVSLDTEVDFIAKESLLRNMTRYFSSITGVYNNVPSMTVGGNVIPYADFLQIGSIQTDAVLFHSILFTSADRANLGHYFVFQGYKAVLASAISTTFKRDTETLWKLKFKLIADATRVYGDMVAQFSRI